MRSHYWVGAEAFGNWDSAQHWAGPTVGLYLFDNTRLSGTYGIHTAGTSGNQFRIALSHEFD